MEDKPKLDVVLESTMMDHFRTTIFASCNIYYSTDNADDEGIEPWGEANDLE